MSFWRIWLLRLKKKLANPSQRPSRRPRIQLRLEIFEDRVVPASFTAGDIAVLQLASTADNTTGTIVQLAPSGANQTNPMTVNISWTDSTPMEFSDSGTSSFLSDTNDGALLVISGYNTTDPVTHDADLASPTSPYTTSDRAVATLDSNEDFTLQTTYAGISSNQTRSATSLDDANYYITDKGGLYTNSATNPSLTTNILNTRTFGGTVYVSSTKGASGVSTLLNPTASSLTTLNGLGSDADIQDFYLVQSGGAGTPYNVLYTLDQGLPTSSTAQINKFYYNGSTWQSEGTYALKNAAGTAISATGMIAENNGSGGVNLYVVTTAQKADNSIVEYTDTAAYNAPISVNGANSVTLYTATGTATLKGIAFTPNASTTPTIVNPTSSAVGGTIATLGGTITDTGGQSISSYGVVYSLTNSDPMLNGSNVSFVAGSGSAPISSAFGIGVTGLQETSTYYYAAYATTSVGTTYTSVSTFTTTAATPTITGGGNVTLGENHAAYTTTLSDINDGENDGNTNVTSVVATYTNASLFAAGAAPTVTGYSTHDRYRHARLYPGRQPERHGSTITVTVTNSPGNTDDGHV